MTPPEPFIKVRVRVRVGVGFRVSVKVGPWALCDDDTFSEVTILHFEEAN